MTAPGRIGARAARRAAIPATVGAPSPAAGPIQRMLIYAGRTEKMDSIIAPAVAFDHRMAGGVALTLDDLLSADRNTHTIARGEPVVIVGHGLAGHVEGHRAETIARALLKIEHIEQAAFILFTGCLAARDQAQQPGTSVVDITHWVLEKANRRPRVVGSPDVTIHDLRRPTGDELAHIRADDASEAIAILRLLGHMMALHDLHGPRWFTSIHEAEAFGAAQLGGDELPETRYRAFNERFVRIMSGDLQSLAAAIADCETALAGLFAKPPTMTDWLRDWQRHDAARQRSSEPFDDKAWCEEIVGVVFGVWQRLRNLHRTGSALSVGRRDGGLVVRDGDGTSATTYRALEAEAAALRLWRSALPSPTAGR